MSTIPTSKPNSPALARFFIFLAVILFLISWAGWAGFQNAGVWLSKSDSPKEAEVIVCLGGPERIRKAAELYHQGYGRVLIVTAEKSKDALIKLKVPSQSITLAPWPETTYQEALAVAPIVKEKGYRTALIISDPFHIQRVRWTFNHVFNKQPVQLEFVSSDLPFVKEQWWKDKMSRFYVISEISKLTYYEIFHGLFRIDREPPWVVGFKHRYERWLLAKC